MKKLTKKDLAWDRKDGFPKRKQAVSKNRKMGMKAPMRLASVLQEALKDSRLKIDPDLFTIWSQWADLVGPIVARQTRPEAIKGTLLLVNVSSAPWLQELQFLKDEIVTKLNTSLGRVAVQDIRFQIGPVSDGSSVSSQKSVV